MEVILEYLDLGVAVQYIYSTKKNKRVEYNTGNNLNAANIQ